MISLFIDTSISFPTVSIIKDNRVLFNFHEEIKNDMSSKILSIIDLGLKENNLSIKSLKKIFVVTGPGSFTGVRIGVTIAKTIAWSLRIPVIPISSLEYMSTTNTDKKYIVSMIDARRGNVFAGIYDINLNSIKKDLLINKQELLSNIKIDEYELISYDDFKDTIRPEPIVLKIINKYINDNGVNPHNLKPNYLKLTEAEENRFKND